MEKCAPIGIFDSGYGGLTVFRSIAAHLSAFDYLYLGDNARTPYGPRSFETVYEYTLEGVKYLFSQGCSLVILACNTASAKALRQIQQQDLPIIAPEKRVLGVIRPTAEVIGNYSRTGSAGVVATEGTVLSNSYPVEIRHFFPELKVFQQACPMWVPLVENQEWDNPGGDYFIQKYVHTLFSRSADIDTLLLGCTHYPIIEAKIRAYLPKGCTLLSQGEIVARSLVQYLERHPEIEERCSRQARQTFLTTDTPEKFDRQAPVFLGYAVRSKQVVL